MKDLLYGLIYSFFSFFRKVDYKASDYILKKRLKSCGRNVTFGRNCFVSAPQVSIGDDVYIGDGAYISASVSNIYIGNKVMFGPNVEIHSGNHRFDIVGKYMFDISFDQKRPEDDLDVVIGDDVWIGAKCIILNGVHIGEGSIIGAGTVVSKDVPPYSILTGSRPLALRKRFSEEEIIEHKKQLK